MNTRDVDDLTADYKSAVERLSRMRHDPFCTEADMLEAKARVAAIERLVLQAAQLELTFKEKGEPCPR